MTIILILLAVAAFWAVCSVLSYKATFAYFQKEWPKLAEEDRTTDRTRAWYMVVMGPLGLIVAAWGSSFFKHGFSVTPEVDHDYEAARDAWESEERAKADVDDQYEAAQADWESNERWKDE